MTNSPCLFCGKPEPGYKPGPNVEFICSRCTVLLANAEQNDLKKAYTMAIKKGYPGKAKAIKSFIIEDELNVTKTEKLKRGMARKRPLRKTRLAHHRDRA